MTIAVTMTGAGAAPLAAGAALLTPLAGDGAGDFAGALGAALPLVVAPVLPLSAIDAVATALPGLDERAPLVIAAAATPASVPPAFASGDVPMTPLPFDADDRPAQAGQSAFSDGPPAPVQAAMGVEALAPGRNGRRSAMLPPASIDGAATIAGRLRAAMKTALSPAIVDETAVQPEQTMFALPGVPAPLLGDPIPLGRHAGDPAPAPAPSGVPGRPQSGASHQDTNAALALPAGGISPGLDPASDPAPADFASTSATAAELPGGRPGSAIGADRHPGGTRAPRFGLAESPPLTALAIDPRSLATAPAPPVDAVASEETDGLTVPVPAGRLPDDALLENTRSGRAVPIADADRVKLRPGPPAKTADALVADPSPAARGQPVPSVVALPVALAADAPAPAQPASRPGSEPGPAAPTPITVASDSLGDVGIRLEGGLQDLRVQFSGSMAAANTMAADAPRLIADLAVGGVRVQSLDFAARAEAGPAAELGSGAGQSLANGPGQPQGDGRPRQAPLPRAAAGETLFAEAPRDGARRPASPDRYA